VCLRVFVFEKYIASHESTFFRFHSSVRICVVQLPVTCGDLNILSNLNSANIGIFWWVLSYKTECICLRVCVSLCLSDLCSLCTATVLGGSARNLACSILIPSGWSWGLASAARAGGIMLRAPGKFGNSGCKNGAVVLNKNC